MADAKHCIARGCGIRFDNSIPESRTNLRSFWYRYCPKHRTQGNAGSEVIVGIPASNPFDGAQFAPQEPDSIELFCTSSSWMAKSRGPHADAIRELFNTDTLPTAFTAQAEATTVLAEVSKLNPGIRVYLRTEGR